MRFGSVEEAGEQLWDACAGGLLGFNEGPPGVNRWVQGASGLSGWFKAHRGLLGVFPSLMAEAVLEKLWTTAAYGLGNRTGPLNAAHRPFWSGYLVTNLCDFPTEVGREDLPLLLGPSMHQETVIVLTTLRWDLFPICPLTQESHWSSARAMLWLVLCLVLFLYCPVLLMWLPGLILERFLSLWTYLMITGQLTEPDAAVGPAVLTLLGCCGTVFLHSGCCPHLPCCHSWLPDCCSLWGSPILATHWHLQIALGSRKLLVRTCLTAWAGSTLQNS